MHLKRSLGLAAVVLAASAILIATAGAAQGPQTVHRQFHFKTTAAVFKYLKAHGVSTRGMVVQRGLHNYAGPKCPGKRWNCTKSRHVIQFSGSDSSNSFYCSPSYNANPPATPTPASSPNNCVIVQVRLTGNGSNNAKCVEQSSAPGAGLNCQIWQENVNGANNATTIQLITQRNGVDQNGSESSDVHQQNTSGANNATVLQTTWQNTFTSVSLDQRQTANVNNTILQNGASTQLSTMSQLVIQVASAGKKRDEDDGHDGHESAPSAPATSTPFSSTQNQLGDGTSNVDQHSSGVSKAFNFQNMFQKETAPSGVTQEQNGPFRCCTRQDSNSADLFIIQQSKTQLTSSGSASDQYLDEIGEFDTTGQGHIRQFARQNNDSATNSCDVTIAGGGACFAEQTCAHGESSVTSCADGQTSCSTDNGCCVPFQCESFALAGNSSTPKSVSRMSKPSRLARFKHHF